MAANRWELSLGTSRRRGATRRQRPLGPVVQDGTIDAHRLASWRMVSHSFSRMHATCHENSAVHRERERPDRDGLVAVLRVRMHVVRVP